MDKYKDCKFYHGEDTPPFDDDGKNRLWFMEKRYLFEDIQIDKDYWETDGYKTVIESFPDIKAFIESKELTKQQKGMLAWEAIMSYSHDPVTGVKFITKYGKD